MRLPSGSSWAKNPSALEDKISQAHNVHVALVSLDCAAETNQNTSHPLMLWARYQASGQQDGELQDAVV